MFQRLMTRRAALLALVPVLAATIYGDVAHAGANTVIHGTVLSVAPSTKTFRVRVQETGQERTIFTTAQTMFRFSNNKTAEFTDVKVGKTVEITVQVRSADAFNASVVTIRL